MSTNHDEVKEIIKAKEEELKKAKTDTPLESIFHKIKPSKVAFYQIIQKGPELSLILDINLARNNQESLPKNFPLQDPFLSAVATPTDRDILYGDHSNLQILDGLEIDKPLYQDDLIIDPYQIYHSRFLGNHILPLYAGSVSDSDLLTLFLLGRQHGMTPIIHVYDAQGLETAMSTPTNFIEMAEKDYFGRKMTINEMCELAEEIPEEKFLIARLSDWSTEKLEYLFDAEFNVVRLAIPDNTRNLNRLLSTLKELK